MKRPFALIAIILFVAEAFAQPFSLSSANPTFAAGTYPAPLTLDVQIPQGAKVSYRFLENPQATFEDWAGAVVLDAMEGESRAYTLRLTTMLSTGESITKDHHYVVRRDTLPIPVLQPPPGYFSSEVAPTLRLPSGWSVTESGRPVIQPLRLVVAPGDRKTFVLEGRRPGTTQVSWTYIVDRRDQEGQSLDIVSPIPGSWANRQSLIVSFRGFDRLVWNWGASADPATAHPFTGVVPLERIGAQQVTVSGHSRLDGRWISKTVSWSNGNGSLPAENWPTSNAYPSGLDLPEASGWSLSWDGGKSWQMSQNQHREAAAESSRKLFELLAKKDGQTQRFVYILDGQQMSAPRLEFYGGWNPVVAFSGAPEAYYRVTWTGADGTIRVDPLGLWGPLGSWKVPDGTVAARVESVGINGQTSPSSTLGFAETGWSMPVFEGWDQHGPQTDRSRLPLGGRIPARPGFSPVYEISDRPEVPEPSDASPQLEGAFLPPVPLGCDRTFYVRFAWRDWAGLTGPATAPITVRVDRVAPASPEVVEAGGQLLVKPAEGEEDGLGLYWAVTTERVSSPEALSFQPYRTALDEASLLAGVTGRLWFHSQAQDRSGNWGPARLNVAVSPLEPAGDTGVVQVDPNPTVGDTPVEDRGVYPWPQFRLRSLDRTRDLWVGVTDQLGVPSDWSGRVQPWTGVFSRAVGRGERRTFVVFWNAKTADGWLWSEPKSLTLTLDQGPPAVPVSTTLWPSAPQSTAWTLRLQPGRAGDTLRYTVTLDGTVPPDPAVEGQPWAGTQTWDAPPGGRIQLRLRFLAVAVSGLSIEMPLPQRVVLDRTIPPPVNPKLEPFTYEPGPWSIPAPSSTFQVRYSLTSDGSNPEVPSSDSPTVPPSGLALEGVPGQTVLYRIRWRSYSIAGLPGPPTEAYSVLVDRTAPTAVPESTAMNLDAVPLPRVTGLPASGISARPVTFQVQWPSGVLRYEIREGLGVPRAVTTTSKPWAGPLTLDGADGQDRTYTVGLRGFSPDGRPLTQEIQYTVRVDRSFPLPPDLSLLPDPRRPEARLNSTVAGANSDEVLYYRWTWQSFPRGNGELTWQVWGTEAPLFAAPEGALTRLTVQAFLRDEAGNEGPVVESSLLIDQNVVYLVPQGTGDGTREHPLGSLADALTKMRLEGRALLFVATGQFPVLKTLDLGGLKVYGGWNSESWELAPATGRSLFVAYAPFRGSSLIESGDRDWSLQNVDLATGTVSLDAAIDVHGAQVSVRSSNWSFAHVPLGWSQEGGGFQASEVSASYSAEPQGNLVHLKDVEATLRGFNVAAEGNFGGVLFSLENSEAVVQDLVVVSKKSQRFDAVWSSTQGKLSLDRARVLVGEGSLRSTAFLFKDCDASLWNTEVALYGSLSNTGYQVSGGHLDLQKVVVSLLRGGEFNQGFVLDHVQAQIRNLQLKIESGSYQGAVSVDGGSLSLETARIQLAGGGKQAWGGQFLSQVKVTFRDVQWILENKTPGDLWKLTTPWAPGSASVDSSVVGWPVP